MLLNKGNVLKNYLIALLITLLSGMANAAQTVKNYEVDVTVNSAADKISVQAKVTLNNDGMGELALLLHPSAQHLKVLVDDRLVAFNFAKDAKTKPNMYFDGQLLTVNQQDFSQRNKLTFTYELPIAAVNYWRDDNLLADFDLKNGFELGMYTSWLPLPNKNGSFTYQIAVTAPKEYAVLGNGNIEQSDEQHWQVNSIEQQFDIPLMVSSRLQTATVNYQQLRVEVSHFGLPKEKVNQLGDDIKDILSLFEAKFGVTGAKGKVQFAFVPRVSGTSYSRRGFAVIAGKSPTVKFSTLAHEIAHFWWTGADSSSWQDWINESFSEYSSLMAYKQKYGADKFVERLAKYEKISKNSKPIWGVDRGDDIATLLLYRKGPIILEKLRLRLGDEKYFNFLAELAHEKNRNTEKLLEILAEKTSKLDADWLEGLLKQ